MKKTGDEEEIKLKTNPENKSNFSIDSSKYQSFIDEIVTLELNLERKRHEHI